MSTVLSMEVFDIIRVFYIKILLHNGELFIKINNGVYRRVKLTPKDKFEDIEFPIIYVKKLVVNSKYDNGEDSIAPLVYSLLGNIVMSVGMPLLNKYIVADNVDFNILPFDYNESFYIDITIVTGPQTIRSIFKLALYNIRRRRRMNGIAKYDRRYT